MLLLMRDQEKFNEGVAVGEMRGEARGRREASVEFARRLRNAGMSDIQIHQLTDLSLEEIGTI